MTVLRRRPIGLRLEVNDALLATVTAYAARHGGRGPDVIVLTPHMVDQLAEEVFLCQDLILDQWMFRERLRAQVMRGLATFAGSTIVVRPKPERWPRSLDGMQASKYAG